MKFSKKLTLFATVVTILIATVTISTASTGGANNLFLPVLANDLPVIIPDTTEVITNAVTNDLLSISDDLSVLTFSQLSPDLVDIDVGDVIASDVAAMTPNGFLRKVTSIEQINGQVIVQTEFASLEEAIEQGSISVQRTFTPDDLTNITLAEGVTFLSDESKRAEKFEFQIATVMYEDGPAKIRLNGSFSIQPSINFDADISRSSLKRLEFALTVDEEAKIQVLGEVDIATVKIRQEIGTLSLGKIRMFVGWVPVVIVVEMPIYVTLADGKYSIGLATEITQEGQISAGLRYEDGQWSPISNIVNDVSWERPHPTQRIVLMGSIDPLLTFLLYGVAGPQAGINPYLKFKVDTLDNYAWTLSAGVQADVGITIRILSKTLADHQEAVLRFETVLEEGNFVQPTATPTLRPTSTPTPTRTPTVTPTSTPRPTSTPTVFSCSTAEVSQSECDALVALHDSTNGTNWAVTSGWLETNAVCSWYGVVCNNQAQVSELQLPMNLLNGTLPSTLGNLVHLQYLDIQANELSGSLPQSLTATNMSIFIFSDTELCIPNNTEFQSWLNTTTYIGTDIYCDSP